MPFAYPIRCTNNGCDHPAQYKIAARWTDGITEELKTYGLTCAACLPEVFRTSLEKQRKYKYHLAHGEALEPPGIYQLERGQRHDQLQRLPDLEKQLRSTEEK